MMSQNKKYFWLKLKDDFFNQKEIKMLRRIAGGDTYTIIYLKMLLLSLKNDGKIYFDDIAENFVEEIALDIDEDVENVQITFNYLQQKKLVEFYNDAELEMSNIASMIGSETDAARRKRKQRMKENTSLRDNVTTKSQLGHTEIDIELEKDIEIDTELEKDIEKKEKNNALFEKWWKIYPKKIGSKKIIEKKFNIAIEEVGEKQFFTATEVYLKTQNQVQYICAPEVFINQERYSKDNIETYQKMIEEKSSKFINPDDSDNPLEYLNWLTTEKNKNKLQEENLPF